MVNLAARDLLDEAWNELTTWARHLIESRGADDKTLPRMLTPRTLADWLADRVQSLRYDEAGKEAHRRLIAVRHKLLRAVDRSPSRVYAGPCDGKDDNGQRCGRPLYAMFNPFRVRDNDEADETGTERVVVCDGWRMIGDKEWDPADHGCGAEYTAAERRYWLEAELADKLDTIGYWMYWLPKVMHDLPTVPESVMRSWTRELGPQKRARLVPHSVNRDGDPLFRGGDVMDLMARYKPKRYAPRPNRGMMSA